MPERAGRGGAGRLAGRAALVTGAGSGIGAATARRLVADGAWVLLVDRAPGVERLAAELGGPALCLDLAAPDAAERVAAAARDAFGGLDILVNNAGIGGSRALAESDDALLERIIGTNLLAVLRLTRAVLPDLARPGGRIVNLASVYGIAGWPGTTAYAVAKAGLAQLTRQLAAELGPEGILVNAVAPGAIETPMTASRMQDPWYRGAMVEAAPLRRAGRAEEVAAVIAFLASEDASFVTGQVIAVDGGWLAARHPPAPGPMQEGEERG